MSNFKMSDSGQLMHTIAESLSCAPETDLTSLNCTRIKVSAENETNKTHGFITSAPKDPKGLGLGLGIGLVAGFCLKTSQLFLTHRRVWKPPLKLRFKHQDNCP